MLIKIQEKYVSYTTEEGTLFRTITKDCHEDRFERLREIDQEFYQEKGKHLYTNFETGE